MASQIQRDGAPPKPQMIQRFAPLDGVAAISMDEQNREATYARVIDGQLALGPCNCSECQHLFSLTLDIVETGTDERGQAKLAT